MRPDVIYDLRHNANVLESCGQPGRAAQLREAADALEEQQRHITRLMAALKSLMPIPFTGTPSRAAMIDHLEHERMLGHGEAARVLEAYAAIAEAEVADVSKGA